MKIFSLLVIIKTLRMAFKYIQTPISEVLMKLIIKISSDFYCYNYMGNLTVDLDETRNIYMMYS